MVIGITGYGAYIPKRRIRVEDIVSLWDNMPPAVQRGLRVSERAVLGTDEDTNTMSVAAAKDALVRAGIERGDIGALFLGTATNPYDSRPSSTMVAEALGLRSDLNCADIQFSGKSGTAAIQVCMALVMSGMAAKALAIGSDTINRHVAPGDVYEVTASAAAVACVIGSENLIAEFEGWHSVCSDLSDFFRLEGERYIRSGMGRGGSVWEIGLIDHVKRASEALLHKLGSKPGDYSYAVFQQPYGSTAFTLARELGFTEAQVSPAVLATSIGDCGAASALLPLAHILDTARGGERIFLASYGFGAGADAFSIKVLPSVKSKRSKGTTVKALLSNKIMVDYATAIKLEYKYLGHEFPLSAYF